ncbi:heme lyase CcmF/NrfE family subunit [Meiothermus granaticius]|uniref:Cytochrome c-type biogenesis protein CcmF n=1 Tax=Meiothermus granaticius NBRC 107808 TaxID=1227551 RepID=A0A399F7K0_9DEIN|nr:cytochrome c-type biogenesis CcmF C-terminal domain-containing protein [Meiothermus granaticius]RIH92208.1 Cytochrome c-type biogenesis protein CcmF [Meiothermus granaticius NBRC 107808]GEM85615.1 cytochrome c biogenesis protein CcmF [Meiothermus granaticius NBRC 107808]
MTPGLLGTLALAATLLFSVLGLGLSVLAALLRDRRYLEAARRFAPLSLIGALAAFGALEWALLTNDFSVAYVADNHSLEDPLWVTLVTPWAALAGSILLWGTLQTLYTSLVSARAGQSLDVWRAPIALATLFAIQVFFFGVMSLVVHPFDPVANPPADGRGPNPLLQNHWMMAVHPVLMYLGFVGLSVPFAYAVAAMVARRYQSWIFETRWWTLVAWGFLTAAIFAGKWWSYEILGWGGYWAWDPVENASIIPWFLATAFLHTAQVQERKGLFKGWNFAFITLAFAATVFGTFLTRSGVIQSVHAFADGPVGTVFLGFLLLTLLVGFGLLSKVGSELREAGEVRWVSREGALLAGALFFGTFAFVVVLGTLWPLVIEAVLGAKVSVGAPFFNQVSVPLGVFMLLLMGIGPVLPWRQATSEVVRNLIAMGSALGVGVLIGLLLSLTPGVALAIGLFAYNLTAVGLMVGQGIRERSRALGISRFQAFLALAGQNRRRFGSHLVHLGIALAALAIAFSQTYRFTEQKTLNVGGTWQTHGLEARLLSVGVRQEGNRVAVIAPLEVRALNRDGWASSGRYETRLNFYTQMGGQPIATPVVKYSPYNDYYFVLEEFDREKGSWATLKIIVTPMVLWLWIAGAIVVLGTLYILWPGTVGAPARSALPQT